MHEYLCICSFTVVMYDSRLIWREPVSTHAISALHWWLRSQLGELVYSREGYKPAFCSGLPIGYVTNQVTDIMCWACWLTGAMENGK